MKQIIIGCIALCMIVVFVGIFNNIVSRQTRSEEVRENLTEAIHSSASSVLMFQHETEVDNTGFKTEFIQNLIMQLESESTLIVHVVMADVEKGILAVDITQKFRYGDQSEGSVRCQKTIILDNIVESG